MKPNQTKGNLDVLLLGVLSAGPGHGYEVITALKEKSGGEFDLPEGTVYPSLHRLEDEGLLASSWSAMQGRRRRVYQLTTAGEASLAAGRQSWERFSMGMNLILGAQA
ncbi:MAG: helix-turn-helix transcriptional regulator [Lacisediminihabitans sp.]